MEESWRWQKKEQRIATGLEADIKRPKRKDPRTAKDHGHF
jgi:hypothetical protein